AEKYAAQQKADATLYQRQKQAEAQQFEAQREAEARKAQAEADRFSKEQEAQGVKAYGAAEAAAVKAKGLAEAEAIQARGLAEAEAMEKKAEAYAKYNKAAVAEMMIKVLPDIAGKIAEPLAQIDKITIIGGDGGANGVDQVAGNVPAVMAKLFESMKETTGIDLANIINAESYDAKVNRNITVNGLDGVNMVVNTNAPQDKAQSVDSSQEMLEF
ncbi:MAG: flotillin family protein, partial [Lachnospiraceae bacterium]|nr:flotillin family protein [Lachnospiraceae bacterium]